MRILCIPSGISLERRDPRRRPGPWLLLACLSLCCSGPGDPVSEPVVSQTGTRADAVHERAPCPPYVAPMFRIRVVDAVDATEICDARIEARDGDEVLLLEPHDCVHQDRGANRTGRYTLTISAPGYETQRIADVVVAADPTGCTVETHDDEVRLTRASE